MTTGTHGQLSGRQQGHAAIVVVTVLAQLLLTLAAVCGLYIAWMQWWTGVNAAHDQYETRQSVPWAHSTLDSRSTDGTVRIASPQPADSEVPVQPQSAQTGELMGMVYIPRFGQQWNRNLVQGVELAQLNTAGLGHYPTTQMPGAVGNVAIAGHRNGYGQPLGDIDQLREGDAIIVRTQDYWYVYRYTNYKIVTPDDTSAIVPNPEDPTAAPTKRMITLTTCEPKYSTPTHRWIAYGEFEYWAKTADGVPKELAGDNAHGVTQFDMRDFDGMPTWLVKIGSLATVFLWLVVAYIVLFVLGALIFRWPRWKRRTASDARRASDRTVTRAPAGFYGWIVRLQPGPAVVQWILVLILALIAVVALFEWGFPWAASHIDFLRAMSGYTVGN